MIYNAINNFDMLNDACIRYTSVMSDTLGITYGTMCIVLYILIPLLWTAVLICSSRLLITRVRDKRVKIDEICEVDKSKDGHWYDRL